MIGQDIQRTDFRCHQMQLGVLPVIPHRTATNHVGHTNSTAATLPRLLPLRAAPILPTRSTALISWRI
jgi:hypothetical protein